MPEWLVKLFLPYVVPIIIQGLTPIIVEYMKKAADYWNARVPASLAVTMAGLVSEAVNQASAWLAGASLPPGVGAIIAVFLNELGKDFGKQPPTPGVA